MMWLKVSINVILNERYRLDFPFSRISTASAFSVPVSMHWCFKGEDWFDWISHPILLNTKSSKKRILHSCLCVKMCISNLNLLLDLYMFVYEYSYIITLVVYSFAVIHIVRRTFTLTPTFNFQTQDSQAACWFLEYLDQAPFWWWRGPQGGWISTFLTSRVSKVEVLDLKRSLLYMEV